MKKFISLLLVIILTFSICSCQGTHVCTDVDKNAKCDVCGEDVECTSCIDVDKNAKCDVCGKKVNCTSCVDVDKNAKCDVCSKRIDCKVCVDEDPKDAKCDICGKALPCTECVDRDRSGKCDICGKAVTEQKYSERGMNFVLPNYMKELDVSADYADIAYGTLDDRNLEFTIYFYSSAELLSDLLLNTDVTVKEYADWFVEYNEYENVEEEYDKAGKKITLRYVFEEGNDRYFFYDYIVRNEYMLYHVTMSCNPEDRAEYEGLFDEWVAKISLDY